MTGKISPELGDVQKTLLLPLWGRAMESQKARPLMKDPTAVDIIKKLDFDFSPLTRNIASLTQMAWIARSLLVDRVVSMFLKEHSRGTVVNIGCGLDTTFDRVDNGVLKWYDLDLPDVIELRKAFIPESARRTMLASSFLEDDWFDKLSIEDNVLFIAAGVFYYFKESQIKEFFHRIGRRFPGSEMVFDAASPFGVKAANKLVIRSSGLDEKSFLVWGLKNAREIRNWGDGIKIRHQYSYFLRMKRGLTFRDRMTGLVSDALKIQWLIHLQFPLAGKT